MYSGRTPPSSPGTRRPSRVGHCSQPFTAHSPATPCGDACRPPETPCTDYPSTVTSGWEMLYGARRMGDSADGRGSSFAEPGARGLPSRLESPTPVKFASQHRRCPEEDRRRKTHMDGTPVGAAPANRPRDFIECALQIDGPNNLRASEFCTTQRFLKGDRGLAARWQSAARAAGRAPKRRCSSLRSRQQCRRPPGSPSGK